MTVFSRRTVLTGAAAATAATTVGPAIAPSGAQTPNAPVSELDLFVNMSAALTGISKAKLSPSPRDQINIKQVYFDRAKTDPLFDHLLQVFSANQATPDKAAEIILNQGGPTARMRFLARSIILAWYLGAWYDPDDLLRYSKPNPPADPIPFEIISPMAYTRGWIWSIAQAHPMGYSEGLFGYWSDVPPDLNKLII
jgi:hypothetical protein